MEQNHCFINKLRGNFVLKHQFFCCCESMFNLNKRKTRTRPTDFLHVSFLFSCCVNSNKNHPESPTDPTAEFLLSVEEFTPSFWLCRNQKRQQTLTS